MLLSEHCKLLRGVHDWMPVAFAQQDRQWDARIQGGLSKPCIHTDSDGIFKLAVLDDTVLLTSYLIVNCVQSNRVLAREPEARHCRMRNSAISTVRRALTEANAQLVRYQGRPSLDPRPASMARAPSSGLRILGTGDAERKSCSTQGMRRNHNLSTSG